MNRGEVYRWRRPGSGDPRRSRPVVVVSRQGLLQTRHSTVVCAPVFTNHDGIETQVVVGTESGLASRSSVHCDNLLSVGREELTDYLGALPPGVLRQLDRALAIALGIDHLADSEV